MTSNEIARVNPAAPGGALSLGAMTPHDAWLFASSMAGSNLLPPEYKNNAGSVLWAMEYGRALGLDVVTTITTIHVIKGKPSQSADLMLSRARSAGHKVRVVSERDHAVVSIWRQDDPDYENRVEWTLEDATKAQLYPGKADSNWAKYTRAMLRARAISECVRTACPEVLHGCIYTPEELGAVVDQDGHVVDAPVQPLRVMDHVEVQRVEPEAAAAPEVNEAAQSIADLAAKADSRTEGRRLWSLGTTGRLHQSAVLAPDTGELDQLGYYLTRRLKELPDAPVPVDADDIPDVEVVDEAADPHAEAAKELRRVAAAAGMSDAELDEGFFSAAGLTIDDASIREIQSWTATLRQSAGAA
jgi:hypothetical protein